MNEIIKLPQVTWVAPTAEDIEKRRIEAESAPKRGRGRPPRDPNAPNAPKVEKVSSGRGPGRPRKLDENGNPVVKPVKEPTGRKRGRPAKIHGTLPMPKPKSERGRGRPRKLDENGNPVVKVKAPVIQGATRGRGRPRKVTTETTNTDTNTSTEFVVVSDNVAVPSPANRLTREQLNKGDIVLLVNDETTGEGELVEIVNPYSDSLCEVKIDDVSFDVMIDHLAPI